MTMLVTVQHLYTAPNFNGRAGYCNKGARDWAAKHGFDWAAFVRNGVDAELLEATGDAMALRLVAHARAMTQAAQRNG